jgi:branched-chain amino acid transport system substrate-binding protein
MRTFILSAFICSTLLASASAWAQPEAISDGVVKIGVLHDASGVFSGISGNGAVEAVRMAVEDFGDKVLGVPIEVIAADHQNTPDVASGIARRWFDVEQVDMVTDLVGSASALAVSAIAAEARRTAIVVGAASSVITGRQCTPYTIQYVVNTPALARATTQSVIEQGGNKWFFITADYAFGHDLEDTVKTMLAESGGTVVGGVRHPVGTTDFSSYMLQAQSSGADVIALANAGGDLVNSINAAHEFHIAQSGEQKLVSLLTFINDVHALGLEKAQNLLFTVAWYWDQDEESRQWARRFHERVGFMPTMNHAGHYSSTIEYLKAIDRAGTDAADAVIRELKSVEINDFFSRNGRIRQDGLKIHDLSLVRVKRPDESAREWDYYEILSTISGEDAYGPLSASECELVVR